MSKHIELLYQIIDFPIGFLSFYDSCILENLSILCYNSQNSTEEVQNMIRIAICDDDKVFLDIVTKNIKNITKNQGLDCEINAFCSGELLLHHYIRSPYDILLLDIDLPKTTGFDIAREVRQSSIKTFIIFVTAKTDLVYSSFDYQPFSFICKNTDSLLQDLEKTFDRLNRHFRQSRIIEITDSRVPVYVAINDIIYIQSERHYLLYYTKKRGLAAPIRERGSLAEKEAALREYCFIKTHSRYVVNIEHVSRFDTLLNTIVMDNGVKIPISRNRFEQVLSEYRKFTRR